jgi:CRISPR system Cascade subunit CasD
MSFMKGTDMATILIRLAAPLQSWGVQSLFTDRDTAREPSKSGVIGMICAALGRDRSADISDLFGLCFGIRADQPGRLERDYHIAQNVLKTDLGMKDSEVTNRFYLADAVFLAGLQGSATLLQQVQNALMNPVWPLYLGRKAFVPSQPVYLLEGYRPEEDLKTALTTFPRLAKGSDEKLRLVIEDETGSEIRPDQPLSFQERKFVQRRVRTDWITPPAVILEEVA